MHEIETWLTRAATATQITAVGGWRSRFLRDRIRQTKYGLTDILPSKVGKCWLVPELESEELPVYEIDATKVEELLQECPYFEYYILASDLSWLVAESDHNVFYVCELPPPANVHP